MEILRGAGVGAWIGFVSMVDRCARVRDTDWVTDRRLRMLSDQLDGVSLITITGVFRNGLL